MSASLMDLIKEYGDARADWATDYVPNRVPEALADVEGRISDVVDLLNAIRQPGTALKASTLSQAIELLTGERPS